MQNHTIYCIKFILLNFSQQNDFFCPTLSAMSAQPMVNVMFLLPAIVNFNSLYFPPVVSFKI